MRHKKKALVFTRAFLNLAEAVRFELTEGYKPSSVFKTGALNRSATLPWALSYKYSFRMANIFQIFHSNLALFNYFLFNSTRATCFLGIHVHLNVLLSIVF